MTKFFNANPIGFYDDDINEIPESAVEITDSEWQTLLEAQSNGKIISTDKNGFPVAIDPPTPDKEQTIKIISNAIQKALDDGAKSWGYTNMVYAASYAASTNPQYAADAAALIQWRDDVWDWAYPKYAGVTPGETPEEFMVDMPKQPAQPKP